MELLTESLNKLIASVGTHSTDQERKDASDKLRYLIIAYGKVQAVQAIQLEHKVFQSMGLVAVDKDALTRLNENMEALVSSSGDALADSDVDWLKAGLPVQPHYLEPANDATIDHEGRSFRVPDPDLQALMDDTEALLSPGGANQDIGMSWAESLQTVLKRLKNAPADDEDEEFNLTPWVRYRVHIVIDNVLGREWLRHFKRNDVKLGAGHLNAQQSAVFSGLCEAFEVEFNCRLALNDRMALLGLTDNEIALYFKRRIEDGKAK